MKRYLLIATRSDSLQKPLENDVFVDAQVARMLLVAGANTAAQDPDFVDFT